MTYGRPRNRDFADARAMEQHVGSFLGSFLIENLDSSDRFDWWLPGAWIDLKEKKQKISKLWQLPCDEPDAFILDELSLRRGLQHPNNAYFIFHDCPMERWFVASAMQVAMADRVRMNRRYESGKAKGKHVLNLLQYHQIESLDEVLPWIMQDQLAVSWKTSECLVAHGTGEL